MFENQLCQSWVILFNFKNDVLDERCHNQHPMPQRPERAHSVTINQNTEHVFLTVLLTRLAWWSPDVADSWGYRAYGISDRTLCPDKAAETPLCSQRTCTLPGTSQSGVWSPPHSYQELKCPPPAKNKDILLIRNLQHLNTEHWPVGILCLCFQITSCFNK